MSSTSEVTIVAGGCAIAIATTLPSTIAAVFEVASNAPTCRALFSFNSGKLSTEPNKDAVRGWVDGPRQVSATTVAGTRIGVRVFRAAFSSAANVGSLFSEAIIAPESRMILTEQEALRNGPLAADRSVHGLFQRKPRKRRGFGLPVPAPGLALQSAKTHVYQSSHGWQRLTREARSLQWFAPLYTLGDLLSEGDRVEGGINSFGFRFDAQSLARNVGAASAPSAGSRSAHPVPRSVRPRVEEPVGSEARPAAFKD
jgi:hypothetical protein